MIKKCALWLRDSFIRNRSLNATRIVAGSFAAIILIGALLLTLPIASRDGQSAGFFTGLFTATSSTCVTGLILVDTWTQWTLFGQAVILTMIQLGGLGFMTVITLVSFALHRRIGLSERLIMVSTLNLNDMDGVVRVVRHALIGTFAMETAGAVPMSVCLIPQFGFLKGTWHAVFHAVSSFCNAGFDLLGGRFGAFSSLAGYNDNPLMLGTTAALIVVGGLGFFVWEDIVDKRCWSRLSVYSKMVLLITAVLIVGGALFFLMEEFDNPATLGDMPLWQKGLNALFQSVTLRTAGFDSIGQGGLRADAHRRLLRLYRRRPQDRHGGRAAAGPALRPHGPGAGHLPRPGDPLPPGAQCHDSGAGGAVCLCVQLHGGVHGGGSALPGQRL